MRAGCDGVGGGQPRLTRSVPALHALADEIKREFLTDEATPRLLAKGDIRVSLMREVAPLFCADRRAE